MSHDSRWKNGREAADHFGISERTLLRWRKTGLLQQGEHYRRKFTGPNSPLLYDLALCSQAMDAACSRDFRSLELVDERKG